MVRPLYNLPNQMFFHIISDGWNVQMFHHHLIPSKPLSRVSPDLLICYVPHCLNLWLIFAILNPFHRVTFFNSMSLIIFPISFCFQFFLCLVFCFCFFLFGGDVGYSELFQDEPIFHWKVVWVKKPSIYSRLTIYCGSAEHSKVLNSCITATVWHNAVSPQLRWHCSHCERGTVTADWLNINALEESFALHPVTCFSCLWHLAELCLKCA